MKKLIKSSPLKFAAILCIGLSALSLSASSWASDRCPKELCDKTQDFCARGMGTNAKAGDCYFIKNGGYKKCSNKNNKDGTITRKVEACHVK